MGEKSIADRVARFIGRGRTPQTPLAPAEIYTGPKIDWSNLDVATAQFMELSETRTGEDLIRTVRKPLKSFKDAVVVNQLEMERDAAVGDDTLEGTVNHFNNIVRLTFNIGSPTKEDWKKLCLALATRDKKKVFSALLELDDKYRRKKRDDFTEEDRELITGEQLETLKATIISAIEGIIGKKSEYIQAGISRMDQTTLNFCKESFLAIAKQIDIESIG